MTKRILLLLSASYALIGQTCTPYNITACTGALGGTGDITGTLPLVHAIKGISYSTHGVAGVRTLDAYYQKTVLVTDTTSPIIVWWHGGGFIAGSASSGDFDGIAGYVLPVEMYKQTFISANYTLTDGTAPKYMPAAIKDANCVLHSIAHFAGTTYPGNAMDMRLGGFSAGSLLTLKTAYDADAAGQTDCEYNDAYKVTRVGTIASWATMQEEWSGYYQITGATCSANSVTATVTPNIITNTLYKHNVVVSGVNPAGYNVGTLGNGGTGPSSAAVATAVSTNTITYPVGSCPAAYVSGGTVVDVNTDNFGNTIKYVWHCGTLGQVPDSGDATSCTPITSAYNVLSHLGPSSPPWRGVSGLVDTTVTPTWHGVEMFAQCQSAGAPCGYSIVSPPGALQNAHFIDATNLYYNPPNGGNGFTAPNGGTGANGIPGWSYPQIMHFLAGSAAGPAF